MIQNIIIIYYVYIVLIFLFIYEAQLITATTSTYWTYLYLSRKYHYLQCSYLPHIDVVLCIRKHSED